MTAITGERLSLPGASTEDVAQIEEVGRQVLMAQYDKYPHLLFGGPEFALGDEGYQSEHAVLYQELAVSLAAASPYDHWQVIDSEAYKRSHSIHRDVHGTSLVFSALRAAAQGSLDDRYEVALRRINATPETQKTLETKVIDDLLGTLSDPKSHPLAVDNHHRVAAALTERSSSANITIVEAAKAVAEMRAGHHVSSVRLDRIAAGIKAAQLTEVHRAQRKALADMADAIHDSAQANGNAMQARKAIQLNEALGFSYRVVAPEPLDSATSVAVAPTKRLTPTRTLIAAGTLSTAILAGTATAGSAAAESANKADVPTTHTRPVASSTTAPNNYMNIRVAAVTTPAQTEARTSPAAPTTAVTPPPMESIVVDETVPVPSAANPGDVLVASPQTATTTTSTPEAPAKTATPAYPQETIIVGQPMVSPKPAAPASGQLTAAQHQIGPNTVAVTVDGNSTANTADTFTQDKEASATSAQAEYDRLLDTGAPIDQLFAARVNVMQLTGKYPAVDSSKQPFIDALMLEMQSLDTTMITRGTPADQVKLVHQRAIAALELAKYPTLRKDLSIEQYIDSHQQYVITLAGAYAQNHFASFSADIIAAYGTGLVSDINMLEASAEAAINDPDAQIAQLNQLDPTGAAAKVQQAQNTAVETAAANQTAAEKRTSEASAALNKAHALAVAALHKLALDTLASKRKLAQLHEAAKQQAGQQHAISAEQLGYADAIAVAKMTAFGINHQRATWFVHFAHQYGQDPYELAGQAFAESGDNPNAVSPAGAIGETQFLQNTFNEVAQQEGFPAGASPLNPYYAIWAQAAFMKRQQTNVLPHVHAGGASQQDLAYAAYNAGPGAVQQYGGIPPYKETQQYIINIRSHVQQIHNQPISVPQATAPSPAAPENTASQKHDGNNPSTAPGPIVSTDRWGRSIPRSIGGVIYYDQHDVRWAFTNYGDPSSPNDTISAAGCGPTTQAMVISTLTGKTVTPVDMARFNQQNGYKVDGVTAWAAFPASAHAYGRQAEQLQLTDESIRAAFRAHPNGLIITNGTDWDSNTPATTGGHIFMIRGVGPDGQYEVNDANNINFSKSKFAKGQILGPMSVAYILY